MDHEDVKDEAPPRGQSALGCEHNGRALLRARIIDRSPPLDVLYCGDCGALGPIPGSPNSPGAPVTLQYWTPPRNAERGR